MKKYVLAFTIFYSVFSFAETSYKSSSEYKEAYSCASTYFKEVGRDSPIPYCIGNSHDPSRIELMAFKDAKSHVFGKPQKTGNLISKKSCDWLYKQALEECVVGRVKESCKDFTGSNGADEFSRASSNGVSSSFKSPEKLNQFLSLCKLACLSDKKPDRKTFGEQICGGD